MFSIVKCRAKKASRASRNVSFKYVQCNRKTVFSEFLVFLYQSESCFQQIGIRASVYFLLISIKADGEYDETNAATTINEDKLRELEHPNESCFRVSRCMGGGRRRFRRTKGCHGLYGSLKKMLKELRSKDKAALYMLFRAVDESGFEKIAKATTSKEA